MRDTDLFQLALGLTSPWKVMRAEFSGIDGRLDLYVDFPPRSRFVCAECGREGCGVHDTKSETWRHLDFFQHRTFLHARAPRVICAKCGVHKVTVGWARAGSDFTLLFEAYVLALAKAKSQDHRLPHRWRRSGQFHYMNPDSPTRNSEEPRYCWKPGSETRVSRTAIQTVPDNIKSSVAKLWCLVFQVFQSWLDPLPLPSVAFVPKRLKQETQPKPVANERQIHFSPSFGYQLLSSANPSHNST